MRVDFSIFGHQRKGRLEFRHFRWDTDPQPIPGTNRAVARAATYAVLVSDDDPQDEFWGPGAFCSVDDQFVKSVGRDLAVRRLAAMISAQGFDSEAGLILQAYFTRHKQPVAPKLQKNPETAKALRDRLFGTNLPQPDLVAQARQSLLALGITFKD